MTAFFASLAGKGIAAAVALGLLGGGYVWITTAAYNRGVTATVKRMQVLIDKGTERRDADLDRLKTTPEDKLDEELRKLCELHKKPEQVCQ